MTNKEYSKGKKDLQAFIGSYCMPRCIKLIKARSPFDYPFFILKIKGKKAWFTDADSRVFECLLDDLLF